jgi:hypothetical protein
LQQVNALPRCFVQGEQVRRHEKLHDHQAKSVRSREVPAGVRPSQAERSKAGLTDLGQFCAAEDPNTVVVVLEVADIARAKAYWHSTVLAKGRTEAGIVGPVEAGVDQVWLTDGLVKDRITTAA